MIWSPGQERGLDAVNRWKKSRSKPFFLLAGYAGTGKSTLARHFAEGAGNVLYAAYTGKAAHVLRRTGIDATTIHRLIYTPRDKCDQHLRDLQAERARLARQKHLTDLEATLADLDAKIAAEVANLRRPIFTLNTESILWDADLLILDEYSMIDEQTGRDLLSFKVPILALGDPGQLPPVQGVRFFHQEPDVLLEEIHRQAAGDPIIRLATLARLGKPIPCGQYGPSRVLNRDLTSNYELGRLVTETDQLLVGLNATRRHFNLEIRKTRGYASDLPVRGDKLVCLRNNHQEGLMNGQTWDVVRSSTKNGFLLLSLTNEDGNKLTTLAHPNSFRENHLGTFERDVANEFDYGYALTVHKAQGSQWDSVVLVDEWHGSSRAEWLYTGITRAAKSITILQ